MYIYFSSNTKNSRKNLNSLKKNYYDFGGNIGYNLNLHL